MVGGRDLAKGQSLAAELDGRVSAAYVDAFDARLLDEFCSRCSIVLNCAGPVSGLRDRVAQAAFRARCHYIDLAGLSFVMESMLPLAPKIAELGLSFVVSAGWMPGLSELLPIHAYLQAKTKTDAIDSVTVYFGDSGEWSANALRDAVFYLRQRGIRRPTHFHKGERVPAKMSEGLTKVTLGERLGQLHFSMLSTDEQNEMGRRLSDCDVFTYAYLPGLHTAMAGSLIALLPLPEVLTVRLLGNAWRGNRLPVGGFVVARVLGRAQGRSVEVTAQIVFEKGQDYWINGLVMASVARMVAEGKGVRTGVHFLSDAVAPAAFMEELRKAGVERTENFRACES